MYTYFIVNSESKTVKIGRSANPATRLKQLQTSHHVPLILARYIKGDYEKVLHSKFKKYHIINEWFKYSKVISNFINNKEAIAKLKTK